MAAVLEYSYSYSYSSTTRVHASTRPVLDYQYSKFIWTWPVLDSLYSNFACTRMSSTRYSASVLESTIRVQRLIDSPRWVLPTYKLIICIGPIRSYFGPIRKKRADTHFFIPDTHNVIVMVWLRNIFHDAACISRQNLDEKAVIVLHFFVSRTHVLCAPRDVHTAHSTVCTVYSTHTYMCIQCYPATVCATTRTW